MDGSPRPGGAATSTPRIPSATAPVGPGVAVLTELASIALESAPLGLVLQRLALIAERAIPGASAVSVTVVRAKAPMSAGFTGAVAAVLDERQYSDGFGPCLRAAAAAADVVIADTTAEGVYPGFAAVAARHGIGSVAAIGLAVAGPAAAALNVYRTAPAAEDVAAMAETVRVARVIGAYVAVAVSNAAALDAEHSAAVQLGAAMDSRATIEQAKGVLMAQNSIDAEAAFALLATASQHANVKLREVAAQVVATAADGGAHRSALP